MSSSRSVDTYFWSDPWVQRATVAQRYLFLYFLTNPLANIAGIYEITDRQIIADTGIPEEDLALLLDQFRKEKKIFRWGDWVILKNWPKHQTKSPKVLAGIERVLEELSPDLLGFLVAVDYQFPGLKEIAKRLNAIPHPSPENGEISNHPDTLSNQESMVSNHGNIGYQKDEISNRPDTLYSQDNTLLSQEDRVSHSTLLYSTGRGPHVGALRPEEEIPAKPALVDNLVDKSKPRSKLDGLFRDLKISMGGEN